jgi:hypothetical protein
LESSTMDNVRYGNPRIVPILSEQCGDML